MKMFKIILLFSLIILPACSGDSEGESVAVPVADFSADSTSVEQGGTINYSDLSTNTPTSWSWTFDGGTPSSSTDQNPSVTYDTAGTYMVSLTATNSDGGDSETRADYIAVTATSDVFEGYMLMAPMASKETYLIDTDESIVKSWTSSYNPGLSAYLLEDGTLLRTGSLGTSTRFSSTGGAGGIVEMIDWDSNVTWSYSVSSEDECSHHDVEYLSNGNILMIVWENKTSTEAIAAGRDTDLLDDDEVWPDKIIEVDPTDDSIVWEWHVWDHLVQDYDSELPNYAVVADHPELIDLNYTTGKRAGADWNHINSIDYNEELNQVIVSSHEFSEFWVIDHSTTTEEAASHSGGDYGKGGDILYRWGNPEAYGTTGDQMLFMQHDAQWIPSGSPGAGNILVFNNGQNRTDGDYSTVDEIVPDVNEDGSYDVPASGEAFGPSSQEWIYNESGDTDFYGTNISGAQRLSNGNTLICEGPEGYIFEVTYDGTVVWTYQNALGGMSQSVFRVYKYPYEYSGFSQLY